MGHHLVVPELEAVCDRWSLRGVDIHHLQNEVNYGLVVDLSLQLLSGIVDTLSIPMQSSQVEESISVHQDLSQDTTQ